MRLKTKYQVLFLAAIVLGIYYITLSSGFNSVDDPHIVAAYEIEPGKEFIDLFRPTGTYYYRPLIELSYYLDNLLWGMHPRFMHLENILFHLLNTVLVFFVARQVADAWSEKEPWFPLLSSLLFAVHPINTEPIAWIAGRTDPLTGVFILSAIWCLLQCLIKDRLIYIWPSLVLFVLGVLTKEIALCFLPAAILLTFCWPGVVRLRKTFLFLLAGIIFGSAMLLLAFVTFRPSFSVTAFINSNTGGISAALQTALMALGFYLKKLVVPLPLNFAIDNVSTFYFLPGIAVTLLLPFWLKRRSLPAITLAVCIVFLLPALLISVKHVAWTPFAERYLYLPSAFFCMGFVSTGTLFMEKIKRRQWLLPFVLGIACCAALISARRTFVWHDNLALYRDTVSKSPDYGAAHLELGVALLQKGLLSEGRTELESAERLNKRPSLRNRIKENLMAVRLQEGDYQGARDYFSRVFKNKEEAAPEFLRLLNKADEGLAIRSTDVSVRKGIFNDMIDTYDVLYRKTADPFNLYQCGVLSFQRGDNSRALIYMRKAVQEAPADTHYTAAAIKWVRKLEVEQ